ncbi:hypothetical protein EBU58_15190, partial [bacterium]|nr:hypothetical protein [bacterium]
GRIEADDVIAASAAPQSVPMPGGQPLQPAPELDALLRRIAAYDPLYFAVMWRWVIIDKNGVRIRPSLVWARSRCSVRIRMSGNYAVVTSCLLRNVPEKSGC